MFVGVDEPATLPSGCELSFTHHTMRSLHTQALHTLCLNSKQPVRDQLVGSKVMKYLERLLNKPPFPGVEMAAAQLLMDWAFLYG